MTKETDDEQRSRRDDANEQPAADAHRVFRQGTRGEERRVAADWSCLDSRRRKRNQHQLGPFPDRRPHHASSGRGEIAVREKGGSHPPPFAKRGRASLGSSIGTRRNAEATRRQERAK